MFLWALCVFMGYWRYGKWYAEECGGTCCAIQTQMGAAILLLTLQHTQLFTIHTPFGVLLRPFGVPSLLWQLTLSAALAVHVLFNLRPLLLDSGMDPDARMQRWVRTVCVLALLAAAVGAVCYAVGVKL